MRFGKKHLWWLALGAALYFLLSYHLVIFGSRIKLLKKSHLTLEYTFFSTSGKPNQKILEIDELRADGIGDLLVDMGRLSEEELEMILANIAAREEERY
jgi:hypothetical protein